MQKDIVEDCLPAVPWLPRLLRTEKTYRRFAFDAKAFLNHEETTKCRAMPNIAAADPFAELAAGSAASFANKIAPPTLPQRASSLIRSQSLGLGFGGTAVADPRPPPLAPKAGKTPTSNGNVPTRHTKQDTSGDHGDLGVGWYDSELQKHKAAAMDATARANALEKRLKEQEEEVREARYDDGALLDACSATRPALVHGIFG